MLALPGLLLCQAGGDNGDANLAVEALVEGRAENDVGAGIDFFANARSSFVNLVGALNKEDDPLIATTLAVQALLSACGD